jgi:DNA transformation protein and related proteins
MATRRALQAPPPRPVVHSEAVAHLLELLHPLGRPEARRMFGAHGVVLDGLFIALVVAEQVYLKAGEPSREAFRLAGGRPFSYTARGRVRQLDFWTPPAEALEGTAELAPWVRHAQAAALQAARAKAPRRSPTRTR